MWFNFQFTRSLEKTCEVESRPMRLIARFDSANEPSLKVKLFSVNTPMVSM